MRTAPVTPARTDPDAWDEHWDAFSEANDRNPAQHFRKRLVLDSLADHGQALRLLDIGSGNGELLRAAAERWPRAELLGLELSVAGVAVATARVPTARFRVCDLLRDPEPEPQEHGWATHATCSEVLEHVDEPARLLRAARAWLAPGAVLVVTVPGGPMSAFDRHIGHRRHFSPSDLRSVLVAAGFEEIEATGAGFPVFNLYRSVVIARGRALIADAQSEAADTVSGRLARTAMAAFRPLLRLSAGRSSRGWQTIALAREPE